MDQNTVYSSPEAQSASPQPSPGPMMINPDFHHLNIDQYHSSPSLTPPQPPISAQLRPRVRSRKMTTNEEGSPHRKRIAVACGRCRKRKIRCSGENPTDPSLPCQNCLNAGHSPCQFLRPFTSENLLLEDRNSSRAVASSRSSQQRLVSSTTSSPSPLGGAGGINGNPHANSSIKTGAGYHIGSAIRSTLPHVSNYQSDDGMFPVNPMQSYATPDPYMLAYRPVQQASYNHLAVNHLNSQSRLENDSMYFGNGGGIPSLPSQRPPALNLGMSYHMVSNTAGSPSQDTINTHEYPSSPLLPSSTIHGEVAKQNDARASPDHRQPPLDSVKSVASAPPPSYAVQSPPVTTQIHSASPRSLSTSTYTMQSSEAYEPMSGSPDGLWHTRSGSSANSRSSDGSDFQYRYTDTTSYRASATYATPLPSNRAVVMGSAPQSAHSTSGIEAPSMHDSPHRI